MDSEPVVIANESGIIVYQNAAAISDPFLQNLRSLDLISNRLTSEEDSELPQAFHSLVHEGEDIRVLIHPTKGSSRWLEGKHLLENGLLMGYSIRIRMAEMDHPEPVHSL